MKCSDFQDWILDEMDGRLAPESAVNLRNHLALCDDCRGFRAAQVEIDRCLTAALQQTRGADFGRRLTFQPGLQPRLGRINEATLPGALLWDLAGVASVAAAAGFGAAYFLPHLIPGLSWVAAGAVLIVGSCLTLAEPRVPSA